MLIKGLGRSQDSVPGLHNGWGTKRENPEVFAPEAAKFGITPEKFHHILTLHDQGVFREKTQQAGGLINALINEGKDHIRSFPISSHSSQKQSFGPKPTLQGNSCSEQSNSCSEPANSCSEPSNSCSCAIQHTAPFYLMSQMSQTLPHLLWSLLDSPVLVHVKPSKGAQSLEPPPCILSL